MWVCTQMHLRICISSYRIGTSLVQKILSPDYLCPKLQAVRCVRYGFVLTVMNIFKESSTPVLHKVF